VLETRKLQIQEKLQANVLRQEEAKKERELLLQTISDNRRVDQETKDQLIALNAQHQRDLLSQIAYNRRQAEVDRGEELRMRAGLREEEREFRCKVEDLRGRPVVQRMHPIRRRAYERHGPSSHF